jgi:ANTAR domain-containing protein
VSTTVPCPPDDGADQPAPGPGPDVWPEDVVRTPAGQPAVVLVRTARGWTPLTPGAPPGMSQGQGPIQVPRGAHGCALPLVEAMALADLVAEEAGAAPEPDRQARLAARGSAADAPADADPRDAELARLRRTVGQLEHALAARVSIERAIGVLAERHGSCPREAFDQLRYRARAQNRPAAELAREVLEGLPPSPAASAEPCPTRGGHQVAGPQGGPLFGPRPAATGSDARAGQRSATSRRVTRTRSGHAEMPGTEAGAHS